ncbi:PREDICTED: probable receptor-like protein kinase At1g49730 isoform X2 [Tarenaya hassleriana]|uniref:probable receptor-like protein kinase At1g49730 isoform X2 n=1 Tax=Tarenaya hassleriana TaxID=28532 RepID=UPI00053CA969|nr:PREDICTED: probable receptor-like protein kinase At1g49730 isoform X2 [Tarenaya hassleriana]
MDDRFCFSCRTRLLLLAWLRRSRSRRIAFIRRYGYKEIVRATDSFRWIIYDNYHGSAYRARFKDGEAALVKEVRSLDLGQESFYEEVKLLGRLHHRHLLTLRGFSTGNKRLLVFDNIENGSLKEHLNDPLRTPLNWKARLQIAIGVAAALEYLLLFSNPPMYQVSISSSNIMLDENFTAKISDVRLNRESRSHSKAPNVSCSEASCSEEESSNVMFQLGVLMLELITGQSSDQQGEDLIEWVQDSSSSNGNSIDKMIDPDLGNSYSSRQLHKLLAVARLCVKSRYEPSSFSITHVYRYLEKKIGTDT